MFVLTYLIPGRVRYWRIFASYEAALTAFPVAVEGHIFPIVEGEDIHEAQTRAYPYMVDNET